MNKTIDYNSSVNQDIKGKFIGREVFCCVNNLMEENKGWEDCTIVDEIDNFEVLYCDHCGGEFPANNYLEECPDCKKDYPDEELILGLEYKTVEVFEWWAVSNWMAEKLKEQGQPIYNSGSVMLWGRCTTGQAILLDHVIGVICNDMEILEGQKNEWSVK